MALGIFWVVTVAVLEVLVGAEARKRVVTSDKTTLRNAIAS